jgi:hypothetical protein
MVLGWRAALFDPTPFGFYVPPPGVREDKELLKAWHEYMNNISRIRVSDQSTGAIQAKDIFRIYSTQSSQISWRARLHTRHNSLWQILSCQDLVKSP